MKKTSITRFLLLIGLLFLLGNQKLFSQVRNENPKYEVDTIHLIDLCKSISLKNDSIRLAVDKSKSPNKGENATEEIKYNNCRRFRTKTLPNKQ